jgi:hypothetical protein
MRISIAFFAFRLHLSCRSTMSGVLAPSLAAPGAIEGGFALLFSIVLERDWNEPVG